MGKKRPRNANLGEEKQSRPHLAGSKQRATKRCRT
jgi:hypothetical protein